MRHSMALAGALAAACHIPNDHFVELPDADLIHTTDVAAFPATANRDVDILFLVDDSPSMLDKQTNLKAGFPSFINVLAALPGGLPNIHLGVATSDLGTSAVDDASPGPSIGVGGMGGCSGVGKAGNLQTNGTTLVSGNFISDIKNPDNSRSTNYTGSLSGAFSAIATVGTGGCGFEQPLEATKRALDNNPNNAGFLRPTANLLVVILSDEDDCSLSHTSLLGVDDGTLGPLQSFRCTRFGVTCDDGGQSTDDMNVVGAKSVCHYNDGSAYLTTSDRYVSFFRGIKADPRTVTVSAIVGDVTPFAVELRTPPGGGNAIPALAHSCMYTDAASATEVADPAVRIASVASKFSHNVVQTVCSPDLTAPLTAIGVQLGNMVGNPCLTQPIAEPADCVVVDSSLAGIETKIPACPAPGSDCFTLVADPVGCVVQPQLRLDVTRINPPPADTVTIARCKLP